MLTGRRAFGGDDVTDVIVAVVSKAPDWTPIPIRVRRLLEACLEKDPKRRLRDIADAWRLLDETPTLPGRTTRPGWLDLTARTAVGALLVTLAGLAWVHYREATPDAQTVRFVLASAQGTDFNDPFGISPDGRSIVFAAVGPDNLITALGPPARFRRTHAHCREPKPSVQPASSGRPTVASSDSLRTAL